MSNSKSVKRSIKSSQLGMRELNFGYAGASGDTLSGPDRNLITPTDLGAGNYLFVVPARIGSLAGKDFFLKGFSSTTADCVVQVTAVDADRITVQCHVAGAAADADIQLCVGIHDFRLDYGI